METTNTTVQPLVKVYTLLVRNPLIKNNVWGTLFHTTSKAKIDHFRNHPNYRNVATQTKVETRLFRANRLPELHNEF